MTVRPVMPRRARSKRGYHRRCAMTYAERFARHYIEVEMRTRQNDQAAMLGSELAARLSPAARYVLDA